MSTFKNFEEIIAWQKARELCKKLKPLIDGMKAGGDYRFKEQLISSAGSIMDNIAEGFERQGNKEFVQFLYIAKGSCGEVRSQVYRAFDYGYLTQEECDIILADALEISRILYGLIDKMYKSGFSGPKFNH
ncbi:MAG: four helix bundle protein [Saprospiraceae bacterium]|nr:four helix bundle protein [Saprospiraceae bacterium]